MISRFLHAVRDSERVALPRTMLKTGADRAALDTALECGVEIGGWVPKGRKAGPRASSDPAIYEKTREIATELLRGV